MLLLNILRREQQIIQISVFNVKVFVNSFMKMREIVIFYFRNTFTVILQFEVEVTVFYLLIYIEKKGKPSKLKTKFLHIFAKVTYSYNLT